MTSTDVGAPVPTRRPRQVTPEPPVVVRPRDLSPVERTGLGRRRRDSAVVHAAAVGPRTGPPLTRHLRATGRDPRRTEPRPPTTTTGLIPTRGGGTVTPSPTTGPRPRKLRPGPSKARPDSRRVPSVDPRTTPTGTAGPGPRSRTTCPPIRSSGDSGAPRRVRAGLGRRQPSLPPAVTGARLNPVYTRVRVW